MPVAICRFRILFADATAVAVLARYQVTCFEKRFAFFDYMLGSDLTSLRNYFAKPKISKTCLFSDQTI